jgi:2-keto-myo-inositol isomerase
MNQRLTRREVITRTGAGLGAGLGAAMTASAPAAESGTGTPSEPFRYCLNMATIRGKRLPIDEEVELAAKAGYRGVEPWVDNIARYAEEGKSLSDLKRRIADLGLAVESAIGFPRWIVDDEAQRAAGMEQMKRDMDLVRRIGGRRIAAPPAGAHRTPGMDLLAVAERYRAVLELGRRMEVVPQLEIWGASQTLGRLGEAAFVVVEAGHPDACLLLDAYHIYKSGSSFAGLKLLNGGAMHVFHVNDYPADPPRETVSDADRVYPGDGVCPLPAILRDLHAAGFRGALSLELFNREYWKQEASVIARTGLEKTRAVVQQAFG